MPSAITPFKLFSYLQNNQNYIIYKKNNEKKIITYIITPLIFTKIKFIKVFVLPNAIFFTYNFPVTESLLRRNIRHTKLYIYENDVLLLFT